MTWIAIVVGVIILIPLAIFFIRRLAGIVALGLGIIGILCLFAKQYIGAVVMFVLAFLCAKITPPDDPDTDYL